MTTKIDTNDRIEKLDSTITSLIDQIEYLASGTTLEPDKRKSGFDPSRDKIRSNSDLIFQLSNSLSSILAVKHTLAYYDKVEEAAKASRAGISKEDEDVFNRFFGTKPKVTGKKYEQ